MKVSTFLVIAAILYGLGGLGSLLVPDQMYAPQVLLDAGGQAVVRAFGAALIGFAVIFWQVRKAADSPVVRAILLGNVVYLVLEIVALGLATLSGVLSPLAWGGIVVDVLLAVGFGYYYARAAGGS